MIRYYCPYCSQQYPLLVKGNDGKMVCGDCGEDLVKVQLITIRQTVAFLLAAAFLVPLLGFAFSFIQDHSYPKPNKSMMSMIILSNELDLHHRLFN